LSFVVGSNAALGDNKFVESEMYKIEKQKVIKSFEYLVVEKINVYTDLELITPQ